MMKGITTILLTFLTVFTMYGQDITGQWNGMLKIPGMQLRLVFHISETENGLSSTMDSPDQNATGIPVTTTTFEDSKLTLEIANLRVEYTGELKDNNIKGTFTQAGQSFPLDLSREEIEGPKRPQEPAEPYPYHSEEVTFKNEKATVTLAGTLTLPQKEGKFPAVILISGSGPQNREGEVFGHKPFLILSDHLTRNGIAVLRYDDRGTAQSTGDLTTATTADFATDVESAIAYLKTRKEINKKKIGLMGHSEGGVIAPMVASRSKKDIDFIVLLAGTAIRGDKLLLLQQELIARVSGASETEIEETKMVNSKIFEMVVYSSDSGQLETDISNYLKQLVKENPEILEETGMTEDDFVSRLGSQVLSPWMQYFIKYDPSLILEKVKCPVLAVNGEKDLQVPPKENLTAIKNALKKGGNKKVTIKEFANLNHLFQECETGSPAEYTTIEQTFSPTALEEITMWILKQVK